MGLIDISETQLVFGYLHSYFQVSGLNRFWFPSLNQEGRGMKFLHDGEKVIGHALTRELTQKVTPELMQKVSNVSAQVDGAQQVVTTLKGADVVLENNSLIQFKRPEYLKTKNLKQYRGYFWPQDLQKPFYRFTIKNNRETTQLTNLVEATKKGFVAQYVSPVFSEEYIFFDRLNEPENLINSYAHIDVKNFAPYLVEIGENNDHSVIYTEQTIKQGRCYCFSEPKIISASMTPLVSNTRLDRKEALNTIISVFFPQERLDNDSDLEEQLELYRQKLLFRFNIWWCFKLAQKGSADHIYA